MVPGEDGVGGVPLDEDRGGVPGRLDGCMFLYLLL